LAVNAASQPLSPALRRNSAAEINPPPEIVEFCENCVDSEALQISTRWLISGVDFDRNDGEPCILGA
jgi:hypothetical protein